MIRERWQPTVASETIRFRRSLAPFQSFELRTRILGWDEKCFYIEQLFVAPSRRGEEIVCAVGLVRALFRGREGNVPTREVLATLGGAVTESPPLPEPVLAWSAAEREYSAPY